MKQCQLEDWNQVWGTYDQALRDAAEQGIPFDATLIGKATMTNIQKDFQIAKVNEELGLVFGYAIVCQDNGEDYYDLQGDHIPEDAMLKAWLGYMEKSGLGVAGDMHKSVEQRGTVVGAFPLTSDIAKSLGITPAKTGMIIAMKPDKDVFDKFKSGERTGFSIGGKVINPEAANG